MWYNITVKRAERYAKPQRASKKIKIKSVSNPLDNPSNLCYNKYVSEREFSTEHKPYRY